MNFRTEIPLKSLSDNQIDYHSKIILLGSCFSENISKKFEYYKFQNTVNPFGVLFQPKAIESFINRVVNLKYFI